VINGLTTVKGQYSGQEASGQYRVTQMLVRRDGRWQIVALQMTPIATTTPAEKKP
jgi:ketosteroid isomerase-like protein